MNGSAKIGSHWRELETPCLLVDVDRMQANITRMQEHCDTGEVELRPHIKTHKMVEVARRQLKAGAAGLVCAKLSEAEAMIPSGVRSIFVAYSLGGTGKAERLRRLVAQVDEVILAVTSEAHFPALAALLAEADVSLPVMMAVDAGLGREGVRSPEAALRLAERIDASPRMELKGLYCHEGHAYRAPAAEKERLARNAVCTLTDIRSALDRPLALWPGSSVTAAIAASMQGVDAVRPGAYVLGDDALARRLQVMTLDDVALTVLATVVDRPEPDLALIDAGSKVFSGDRTPDTRISGFALDGRDLKVTGLSEEHGFVTGSDVESLNVGDKLRWVVAHVCPVVNLAEEAVVVSDDKVTDRWPVEARGCVR